MDFLEAANHLEWLWDHQRGDMACLPEPGTTLLGAAAEEKKIDGLMSFDVMQRYMGC